MVRRLGWIAASLSLLACSSIRGADEDAIKKAVERGVAALQTMQGPDGKWPHGEMGPTALAGLALLECGVPATDKSIQKAAEVIRAASVTMTHTYSISLSILFLDRLGDPEDVPLIESLTVRLLAGQTARGGWTYNCPAISDTEVKRLRTVVNQRADAKQDKEPQRAKANRKVEDLPKEIQDQLALINRAQAQGVGIPQQPGLPANMMADDNSNTQFAVLALWVGRRHGLPVAKAVARTEARFRGTQRPNGGWGYMLPPVLPPGAAPAVMPGMIDNDESPAMTCAGLLGLALGLGTTNEAKNDPKAKKEPVKDRAVQTGLLALGSAIGNPDAGKKANLPVPMLRHNANGRGYYFLWSLERVAVAFGLDTIGNKDWYGWGSDVIVANQNPDGTWTGSYGEGGVDTCFALLFLRKANFVQDLTATLKGQIKDPDERELRAGGVGGDAFKKKIGLKPAFDLDAKPSKNAGERGTSSGGELSDAMKLVGETLQASGVKQEKLIEQLRDNKGSLYTYALADAIPQLTGTAKAKARDALADRMARMTAATLADRLGEENLELRRAAALAVAMKAEKSLIGKLIELLADPEPPVARAAYAALKDLTKQDFGPGAEASRAEQAKAIAAWKAWYARQGRK